MAALLYALPVLSEFLPPLYLHHTSLLVTAVHILLISEPQISAAEAMIDTFYKLLPELYGKESCTANTHCLTHLTKYVRLWGPLWTHSAFEFESMNGHLKNLIHSRNQVHNQLVFSVQVSQMLQRLHTHLAENEDTVSVFLLQYTASENVCVHVCMYVRASVCECVVCVYVYMCGVCMCECGSRSRMLHTRHSLDFIILVFPLHSLCILPIEYTTSSLPPLLPPRGV